MNICKKCGQSVGGFLSNLDQEYCFDCFAGKEAKMYHLKIYSRDNVIIKCRSFYKMLELFDWSNKQHELYPNSWQQVTYNTNIGLIYFNI